MNNSFPLNAFFSVTLCAVLSLFAVHAHAQDLGGKLAATVSNAATKAVIAQVVPPQVQVLPQANISLVSPVGGETYTNGNRYPISWHANIPEIPDAYKQRGFKLMGELRLIDQNPSNKKDLRIAFLNAEELAKGTYEFRAGSQTEMTYGHTSAAQGQYKVWIYIYGYYDCGPNAKCRPLFEAQATSNGPVTIKY